MKLLDNQCISEILNKYNASQKRCFFFDYDGTLVPIQLRPALAIPDSNLISLLEAMGDDGRNNIYIISGRDSKFLENWFGNINITLIAEHGALIKYPQGEWKSNIKDDGKWKGNIRLLLQTFVNKFSGSFIEEKQYSLAWHYRDMVEDIGSKASNELLQKLDSNFIDESLEVLKGKKVIEVKFKSINKGFIINNVIKEIKPDFALCIGDDITDEDMFRVFQDNSLTIKVGSGLSNANFFIPSQNTVFSFLKAFSNDP